MIVKPVGATILWAGGECDDFLSTEGALCSSSISYCDPVYARGATISDGTSSYTVTDFFTPTTSFWVHFKHRNIFPAEVSSSADWIQFVDSTGIPRLIIEPATAGNDFQIKISTLDGSSTKVPLFTSTKTVNSLSLTDFDIFVDYSSGGEIKFYMNKGLITSYTGDITTDGITALSQLKLGSYTTSSSRYSYYSEVIISTTDTRSMRLVTLKPVANGNTMDWTGSVTDVNQYLNDSNTFISSGTAGEIAQFTIPSLPSSSSFDVVALIQSAKALMTTGSPANLRFSVRTGATDYSSSDISLDVVYEPHNYIWNTNPATSNPWTTAEVGTVGFNLGIESAN